MPCSSCLRVPSKRLSLTIVPFPLPLSFSIFRCSCSRAMLIMLAVVGALFTGKSRFHCGFSSRTRVVLRQLASPLLLLFGIIAPHFSLHRSGRILEPFLPSPVEGSSALRSQRMIPRLLETPFPSHAPLLKFWVLPRSTYPDPNTVTGYSLDSHQLLELWLEFGFFSLRILPSPPPPPPHVEQPLDVLATDPSGTLKIEFNRLSAFSPVELPNDTHPSPSLK